MAGEELCPKLQLVKMKHQHPYKVQWLSDSDTIQVEHMVQVSFKIGAYEETLECDVVPMSVYRLLIGLHGNSTEASSTTGERTTIASR